MLMTRSSVERALQYALGLRGEDYVYQQPDRVSCFYLDPEKGCPSCIVGMVLAFHGVDLREVQEQVGADIVLNRLVVGGHLTFESEAEQDIIGEALRAAQLWQDGHGPWSEAVAKAQGVLALRADES